MLNQHKFYSNSLFNQSPMAEPQLTEFKKISNEKQLKFQWGIAEPVIRNQINTKTQVTDTNKQGSNPQPQQPTPKAKLAPNMINFQDLPVKQSQIITTQKQKEYTYSKRIASHSPNSSGVFNETKQHLQRLSNLKNQFQILKGIMIDSKIFDGHHRKSSQLAQNTSKSNLGSLSNTRQVKIGEAVRGKDKISRKDKLSSSSMSEKQMSMKQAQLKQRNNIVNKESYNYTENAEQNIQNSKISNKRSQHHSQNRKASGSRSGSRINENRHNSPRVGGGLMSSNLLQKHSLQLQLRNCLQKIQLLLQNQIILKTKNNELEHKLRDIVSNSTQRKQDSILLLKTQELNQKLIESEQRIQGYRQQNRQLVQRVAKLQAEAISNEAIMEMLKRDKNKEINNTMQMKLAYANLQIQNKRLQMQKQIDKRDLEYEIDRLKKEKQRFKQLEQQKQIYVTAIKHQVGSANIEKDLLKSQYHMERQTDRQKIRRLQAEIQERQRKYKQSLEDLEKKKQLREEAELLQLVEVLHKKKVEGQGQNQLGRELNRLKDQIIKVKKQVDLTQSQFGFQSKVISLEQALVRDNEEKQKHLLEIERFQKQFEDLKDKYRQCQQELDQQTQRYTKTIHQLKSSLQEAEGFKSRYEHAEKQVQHLTQKADEMERIIRKYEDMQSEIMHLREVLSKKQANHNLEIRDARRRVDQAQFQSFKSQEQNKLSLDLNTRKLSSQIQVLNGKIEAIENDRNYYRDNYNMLRQQNEFLALKLKDFEFQRENLIKVESQMDLQQKQRARRQHESQISALNTRFIEEQKKLIEEISVLTNINQELTDKLKRLAFLEIQNDQLRALCKSKVTSDTSVLHLWDIKEVEYSNINEILKFIKDSQKDIKYLETQNAKVKSIQPPVILGQQRIYYGAPPVLPNQTRIYAQQPQTTQYIPSKIPQLFPLSIQPQVYGVPPSPQQLSRPILIQQTPQNQATIQRDFLNQGQKLATVDRIIETKQISKGQIL